MKHEIWKPIEAEPNYAISNMGRVKRIKPFLRNHNVVRHGFQIRTGYISQKGYMRIRLGDKLYMIHRLVAEAFLGKSNPNMEVNHKNFDRTDNRVENLEWLTHRENIKYSALAGRTKQAKYYRQVKNITTGEIFLSHGEAVAKYGVSKAALQQALRRKSKCCGCYWERTGHITKIERKD